MSNDFSTMTAAELRKYAETVQAEYDADEIGGVMGRCIVRDAWARVEAAETAEATTTPTTAEAIANINANEAEAAAVVAAAPHVAAAAVVTKKMRGCDPAARESLIKEEARHRIAAYDASADARKGVLKDAAAVMDAAAVSITQAWDAMPFAALRAAVGGLCRGGTSAPAHPSAAALYHRIGGWRTLDGDVSGGPSYDD